MTFYNQKNKKITEIDLYITLTALLILKFVYNKKLPNQISLGVLIFKVSM